MPGHWSKKSTTFNKAKQAKRGCEGWYEGYPNLIWYSSQHGGNPIKDFKELNDRFVELDIELAELSYSKEAVATLATYVRSLELEKLIDERKIKELYNIVGQIADKVDNRSSTVGLDLEFVSAACEEWKKRECQRAADQFA